MAEKPVDRRTPDRALSHHILPSAATMVGICPTLIGLVKLTEGVSGILRQADECLGVITVVFVISALASYFSIRDRLGPTHSRWLEQIADTLFVVGLIALGVVATLFAYEWV